MKQDNYHRTRNNPIQWLSSLELANQRPVPVRMDTGEILLGTRANRRFMKPLSTRPGRWLDYVRFNGVSTSVKPIIMLLLGLLALGQVGYAQTCNIVTNGTFAGGSSTGWTNSSGGWVFQTSPAVRAFNNTDGAVNEDLSQTLTGLNGGPVAHQVTVSFDLIMQQAGGNSTAITQANLQVLLNGVVYATFNNPTATGAATGKVTVAMANGASISGFDNIQFPGGTTGNSVTDAGIAIVIPWPAGSPNSAALTFRFNAPYSDGSGNTVGSGTGNGQGGDDFGLQNVGSTGNAASAPTLSSGSIAISCPAATANINSLLTSTSTGILWYTNNAHTGTAYATPTAAVAGTYYGFYNSSGCYTPASVSVSVTGVCITCNAGTTAPTLSANTKANTCPASTVDLSTITASNTPANTTLTWFSSATASAGTQLGSITSLASGTYYAAFYDAANACYSPTTAVAVTVTSCLDSDGDGIVDSLDLDDDNDGILDVAEMTCEKIINGTFDTNTAGWTVSGNSGFLASALWFNLNDTPPNGVISQTTTTTPGSPYSLTFVIQSALGATQKLGNMGVRVDIIDVATNTVIATKSIIKNVAPAASVERLPFNATGSTTRIQFTDISTETVGIDVMVDWISILYCDTDNDGIPNSLDLDSDGDGCSDAIEGGAAFNLTNITPAGSLTGTVSSATATLGVPTQAGGGQTIGTSQNAITQSIDCFPQPDSDGDGIPDITDLDDDNDGILDAAECSNSYAATTVSVSNGNSTSGTVAGTNNGLQFDITSLDNSFQLFINGAPIANQELQFIPNTTGTFIRNVAFADGDLYGTQVQNIWLLGTSSLSTPLVRVVISPSGTVSMFGSKVLNGPLFPLVLTTGASFNSVGLSSTSNSFSITQSVNTITYLTGTFSSVNLGTCDTDGDGIPDRLDLDSDGDGCADAIEGGAAFTTANLVSSTMAGGSTNVTQNLGTSVSSASATYGVPTVAGAGQTIGYSQSSAVNACTDTDGDGIADLDDLDDDNDGILDTVENNGLIQNGDFSTASSWSVTQTGIISAGIATVSGGQLAMTADMAVAGNNTVISQPFGSCWAATKSAALNIRWVDGGASPTSFKVQIGNTVYGELLTAVTNVGTFAYTNGAAGNLTTLNQGTGLTNWVINLPANAPIGDLRFVFAPQNAGGADDIYVDNVSVGSQDTDCDGLANSLDLDSDGDGCPDAVEGGAAFTIPGGQVNGTTGQLTGAVSSATATYGVPTIAGMGQTIGISQNSAVNGCIDTDGDGIADVEDLDDDNDGILDTVENANLASNGDFSTTSSWSITQNGTTSAGSAAISGGQLAITTDLSTAGSISIAQLLSGCWAPAKNTALDIRWIDGGASPVSFKVLIGGIVYGEMLTSASNIASFNYSNGASGNLTSLAPSTAFNNWQISLPASAPVGAFSFSFNPLGTGGADDVYADNVVINSSDADCDGFANSVDLDSDGDGCPMLLRAEPRSLQLTLAVVHCRVPSRRPRLPMAYRRLPAWDRPLVSARTRR